MAGQSDRHFAGNVELALARLESILAIEDVQESFNAYRALEDLLKLHGGAYAEPAPRQAVEDLMRFIGAKVQSDLQRAYQAAKAIAINANC